MTAHKAFWLMISIPALGISVWGLALESEPLMMVVRVLGIVAWATVIVMVIRGRWAPRNAEFTIDLTRDRKHWEAWCDRVIELDIEVARPLGFRIEGPNMLDYPGQYSLWLWGPRTARSFVTADAYNPKAGDAGLAALVEYLISVD